MTAADKFVLLCFGAAVVVAMFTVSITATWVGVSALMSFM